MPDANKENTINQVCGQDIFSFAMFLRTFSVNLVAFYHKYRSLIREFQLPSWCMEMWSDTVLRV